MHGLTGTEERDDDGQTYGHFSRSDRYDEKYECLGIVSGKSLCRQVKAGEGDQGEVGGIQHEFEPHEDDEQVAPEQYSGQPQSEEEPTRQKIIRQGRHHKIKSRSVGQWALEPWGWGQIRSFASISSCTGHSLACAMNKVDFAEFLQPIGFVILFECPAA